MTAMPGSTRAVLEPGDALLAVAARPLRYCAAGDAGARRYRGLRVARLEALKDEMTAVDRELGLSMSHGGEPPAAVLADTYQPAGLLSSCQQPSWELQLD